MSNFITADPRTTWLIVCAGLALLGIALLVLARLRWIQSRPISTCVVLSVFAHILLVVSAYMTNLFERPPDWPGPEVIRVSISVDDRTQRQSNEDPRAAKPWERLPSQIPVLPVPASLETRPPKRRQPDTPPVVDRVPELSAHVPTEVLMPAEEPLRPVAPDPSELPHPPLAATPQPLGVNDPALDQGPTGPNHPEPDTLSPRGVDPEQPSGESVRDDPSQPRLQRVVLGPNTPEDSPLVSDTIDHSPARSPTEGGHPDANSPAAPVMPSNAASGSSVSSHSRADDRHWTPASVTPSQWDLDSVSTERRLVSGQPLPQVYRLRVARDRLGLAQPRGANSQTEAAVVNALRWLVRRQSADGRWDASASGAGQEHKVAGQDRASAGIQADTGITGLAVLAFLGAGHTHLDGQHREVVQHALEYLLGRQRSDGNMAGPAKRYAMMYCHGIATLAICESYAMTGDPRMAPYVRRAVGYTLSAQDPYTGGWRYGPGEAGDTSQFGWQVMALVSAQMGGISIPETNRAAMHRFLHSVSSGRYGGLAAYRPHQRGQPTFSMTAEALTCRLFLGGPQSRGALEEAADFLLGKPPGEDQANLYYWYYATLGLSQMEDHHWRTWNRALRQRLLALQRTGGTAAGSWDPDTVWGGHGGRVYSTSLAALCLEVYYRYIPLEAAKVTRVKWR